MGEAGPARVVLSDIRSVAQHCHGLVSSVRGCEGRGLSHHVARAMRDKRGKRWKSDTSDSSKVLQGRRSDISDVCPDTITGGAAADQIDVGTGTDRVVFTTGATTDAITNWAATATGDNAVQDVSDVNGYLAGLVAGSTIINGNGVAVADATAVSVSAALAAGAAALAAANNVFLVNSTTAAGVAAILNDKAFAAAGAQTGDAITVAFIDANADLNIGVARFDVNADTTGIDNASVDVQGIFAGTFTNADVNAANFGFIA